MSTAEQAVITLVIIAFVVFIAHKVRKAKNKTARRGSGSGSGGSTGRKAQKK